MFNPKLKNYSKLFTIDTKYDEIKELKFKTEKHDYVNISKSLKIDNDYYKKTYKSLERKKRFLIVSQILIEPGSTITSSTLSLLNRSISISAKSSTALITSISILITSEYALILKQRYTKIRDWIFEIIFPLEMTIKQTMIDKKDR